MNLGEFKREVEYLDPGLPVEQELIEPKTVEVNVEPVVPAVDMTMPPKIEQAIARVNAMLQAAAHQE